MEYMEQKMQEQIEGGMNERDDLYSKLEKIKKIANNVLCFDDNSDYQTALFQILSELGVSDDDLESLEYIE